MREVLQTIISLSRVIRKRGQIKIRRMILVLPYLNLILLFSKDMAKVHIMTR